ncbi:uncharacterized protein LOC129568711 [Sitodiplosis mosellana]|uniref:uncharacterized protein LOC129568711 n=1 Tax=Sitodiplosis mosellana TaxID=263140 RepID=UPI002443E380|nr:uncharacterized protein LOC129568711 [Sitodiplosis mosellana]
MSSFKSKSSVKFGVKPPQPPKPTNLNLKLNRFVYTKYRAMLGSYNDKANEIIHSLPTKKSILHQMDRRFSIGSNKKTFSAPPPPPVLNGSIPARRIATQPQQEMPSCVQAMMTKDKKPFTYTPGGIDLSQIKSPRMAQRISRNANMEGVTNQPKPSPLAQQNTHTAASGPPPPPSMPVHALPVQVFPQGPPAPPPAPKSAQLNVANGNKSPSMQRKSPQPQSFEPPPFGFRPEIKIPPNPMANLRKVAPPKPKEVDWSEEFRKERSKSPMPGAVAPEPIAQETQSPDSFNVQQQYNKPTHVKVDSPINTVQQPFLPRQTSLKESDKTPTDQNNNFSSNNYGGNFNQSSPQQRIYSPFASSPQPNLPKPLSPVKLNQQEENVPIYVRSSQRATSPKPPTPQQEFGQTQPSPVSSFQRQPSLEQAQTPIYTRSPRNVTASPVVGGRNVTASPVKQFNQTTFSQPNTNDSTEKYPIYVRSFQKQQAPPAPIQTQTRTQAQTPPVSVQQPLSTAQPFVSEPGRQYQQQPNRSANSNAQGTQMPPWMRRTNSKELPEWANNSDEFNLPTAPQSNQPTNQQTNTFSTNSNYPTNESTTQYGNNNSSAGVSKERVVPIQFEQSPTKTPTSPGFTAQPYQSTPPQYNRVQPPPFAPTASNYASTYNDPHKFVDQGYNNVQNWDISQRVTSPTAKSSDGSRVIPIKLEDGHPYIDGPVHVIQSGNYRFIIHDCPLAAELQYVKNRLSDARSTPNQSKSFRVLQQITDTMKVDPNETAAPAELHQPHYSRPLGAQDMNEHQLRKMKLNEDPSKNAPSFEARFRSQFPDWVPCKPHSVLQSVMRPDNDVHNNIYLSHLCIFVADVQVLNTDKNDHLNSFSHLNNSFSNIPYTVSMPPDTPLQSDCEDSIAEAVPLQNDDIYESCIYDSYYDRSPPKSRPVSCYSDSSTIVPRIVVTPTQEDNEKRRASMTNYENLTEKMANQNKAFEKLTSKLNQIYTIEDDANKTELKCDENNDLNSDQKPIFNNQPTLPSPLSNKSTNFENSKILQHSQELDSSQSESDSETEQNDSHSEQHDAETFDTYDRKRNDSLYEIEDIRESELHSDDESADIIEFIIDNSGDATSNCDTVEFNDHLSVIFEEDEHLHRRVKLDSMCSSNSSATLANEDNGSKHFDSAEAEEEEEEEEEEEGDDVSDSDNEEDQSTSVTVRLPLRLSFSRSSNDEEITTVMVGKSEIQVEENVVTTKTLISEDSAPDVSVCVSLRPRSRPSYSQQSSVDTSNNKSVDDYNDNDEDSEVSVSVSLPLRHRTLSPAPLTYRPFTRQQTLSPVLHRNDEFEYKCWNRGFSVDRSTNIPKLKESHWNPREDIFREEYKSQDISNVDESSQNNDECKFYANEDISNENENSVDSEHEPEPEPEPEYLSVRAKIAAFETIPISKKEEFHRQHACTSFDEPSEQDEVKNTDVMKTQNDNNNENIERKEDFKFNQPNYIHHLQNQSNSPINYSSYAETNTPNYSSYIASDYTIVQPIPQYIETQQQYMQHTEQLQNVDNSTEEEEEDEDPENDSKANLSVQQKIAAFEQPSSCPLAKIDARHEITMAREANNVESIGHRFLTEINESQAPNCQTPKFDGFRVQNLNESQLQEICKSPSPKVLQTPNQSVQTEPKCTSKPQSNQNTKLNKLSYMQRSTVDESEIEETDSGVDIHRQISEDIDTESECYSELRKLTRYERAQTHSRLFKILSQEYDSELSDTEKTKVEEDVVPLTRPKKIVHNVSITRKQNPELVKQAETMAERRERLHLNHNSTSIDADNPSSSASPSCVSPTSMTPSVNEKLIDELVQSVLQQTKRRNLRNIPIEKIQSAARRALIQQQEENDSCSYSSFDSTPALTPQEFHDDYYDSDGERNMDIFPSKAFKHLQEQSVYGRKNKLWAARCPRVLSSKTVNSDLSRVTETRESQSPERDQQYGYNY